MFVINEFFSIMNTQYVLNWRKSLGNTLKLDKLNSLLEIKNVRN